RLSAQQLGHRGQQVIHGTGLEQKGRDFRHAGVGRGQVGADQRHRDMAKALIGFDVARQLHAIHARHAQVGQDQRRRLRLHQGDGLHAITGGHDREAFVRQDLAQQVARIWVVFHHQHGFLFASGHLLPPPARCTGLSAGLTDQVTSCEG
ncbi:conserved hypothetical protein, partial [Ricinus communis]